MKIKNLMGAFLALAGLTFGGSAQAGDVWEFIPDSETGASYAAGETVQFRMRTLTRNYGSPEGDRAPFMKTPNLDNYTVRAAFLADPVHAAETLNADYPLQIGVIANGKTVGAKLVTSNVTNDNLATDFVFAYTVETGDYALPLRLAADGSGNPVNSGAGTSKFFFLNGPGSGNEIWSIKATTPPDAGGETFTFDPQMVDQGTSEKDVMAREVIPYNKDGDYLRASFDFRLETLQLDGLSTKGDDDKDYWRVVRGTKCQPAEPTMETLNGYLPLAGGQTVYAWVAPSDGDADDLTEWSWDEESNYAVTIPSGAANVRTLRFEDPDGVARDHNVYVFTIAAGTPNYTFPLKGQTVGGTARIVLSSSPHWNKIGSTGDWIATDFRAKTVYCGEQKPTLSVTLDGSATLATFPNGNHELTNYEKAERLRVTLDGIDSHAAFAVQLAFELNGKATACPSNVIAISTDKDAGYVKNPLKDMTVHFAADATEAEESLNGLYLFILGATKETAVPPGITITPKVVEGSVAIDATNSQHVVIKGMQPIVTKPVGTAEKPGADIIIRGGGRKEVSVDLVDSYRNLHLSPAEASNGCYTVYWTPGNGQADQVITNDVKGLPLIPDSYGQLKFYVSYPKNDATNLASFYVINPEGLKSYWTDAEGKQYADSYVRVIVTRPATVTAQAKYAGVPGDTFDEGLTIDFDFTLDQPDLDPDRSLYAFLQPCNEAASNRCEATFITEDKAGVKGTTGILLWNQKGSTDDTTGGLKLLDGPGNPQPKFRVVLCTTPAYDPSKVVTDYEAQQFPIKVMNVAPAATQFKMEGSSRYINKSGTTTDVVRIEVERDFTPRTIVDVTADLGAPDANQVVLRWRLYEIEDGDEDVEPNEVVYTVGKDTAYTMPGLLDGMKKIVVQAQDKDMRPKAVLVPDPESPGGWKYVMDKDDPEHDWWEDDENGWGPEFVIYVPVSDKPTVNIEAVGGVETLGGLQVFSESQLPPFRTIADPDMGFLVTLSEAYSKSSLRVKLELQCQGKSPTERVDDWTWAVSNGYVTVGVTNLIFNKNSTTSGSKIRNVSLKDFDGTWKDDAKRNGYAMWRVLATVYDPAGATEDKGEGYVHGECDFYVRNEAPVLSSDLDNTDPSSAIEVAKNGTAIVTYALDDIEADLTNGMKVVCTVKGGEVVGEATYLATGGVSVATGEFTVRLTAVGTNTVTITATDKDFDSSSLKFYYAVEKTNDLLLYPAKPTSPSTDSDDIADYFSAAGIGYGRVWANNQLHGIQYWIQTWTSPSSSESVLAYAMGYRAGEQEQKGDANYPAFVDSTGGDTGGTGYATPLKDLDSFFYRWFAKISTANTSENSSWTPYRPVPQLSFDRNVAAAASVISIAFPKQTGATTVYNDISAMAIFSRERMWSDNMGDINGDWVPDSYVMKYKLVTEYGGGADLKDVNYSEDGKTPLCQDYLPLTETVRWSKLIPELTAYDNIENAAAFTPRLKIRGYNDNLNDAVAEYLPNDDGTRTANPAFVDGAKPEKVYAMPDGSYNAASCTVSYVEHLAWKAFAAAKLPEGAVSNKTYFSRWSPERPTDPTKADTDNDGITDGLEYYWWYRAHVGYLDVDSDGREFLRKATGRRYDPKNPGEGKFIDSATIERTFDPLTPIGDVKQDTDNDGLPDLLEFEIGTNPFDFDTDGDGLPDGFELMLGGTDPLLSATTPGVSDAMRNYDGDAMAFTTPKFEKDLVQPTPKVIDDLFTFALVDPQGDTDGIQWYVGKTAPTNVVPIEGKACLTGTSFRVDNRTYVSSAKVPVVDGRLAADLPKETTWEVAKLESLTNALPSLADVLATTTYAALMPARVPAGSEVGGIDEEATYAALAFDEKVGGVNAAWVYGRSVSRVTKGDGLANVGGFGMLAIGRYQDAPAKRQIAALPAKDDNVAYLHHFVYQEFGFDPRTAWNANTPLAPRWGKTVGEGAATEVVANNFAANYSYAGIATRTREYTLYDEFLVLSFFLNNGKLDLADVTATQARPWEKIWSLYTTNGQGPNEPNWEPDNEDYKGRTAETNSGENGCDTDQDGVPDGWELYVMAGPKQGGKYNLVAPYDDGYYSSFGPFVADAAKASVTDNEAKGDYGYMAGDGDGLTELQEFAGTDSCGYYNGYDGAEGFTVYSVGDKAIRRPEEHKQWLNKFFPTDPWNEDTDGDSLKDNEFKNQDGFKCGNFHYGTPVDDGKSCCIPGGGLNPCSVDTDMDGLPDPWEAQFAGEKIYTGDDAQIMTGRDGTAGNPKQGLCDGMDGTVFDAFNTPHKNYTTGAETETEVVILNGTAQVVDRDYDHDGLDNWQEYLTGAMRCWRYDDPLTRWDAIPDGAYYDDYGQFDISRAILWAKEAAPKENISDANAFWYATLIDSSSAIYNPHLLTGMTPCAQYFTRIENGWDPVYGAGETYYLFHDRFDWGYMAKPRKYACCSPLKADTDQDGMDDYWELFHGLNPLLGESGVLEDSDGPCDIVFDAWYDGASAPVSALHNSWLKSVPGNGDYDFTVHPWLNGLAAADPDGDDIRNQDEAIMPLVAPSATWYHTDPTPLWMTDSSYSNSLVRLFFRMPVRFNAIPGVPESVTDPKGREIPLVEFQGYSKGKILAFAPDYWDVSLPGYDNWAYSFEENEGYDTDHDSTSDFEELQGKVRSKTDPQDADSPRRRQAMHFGGPANPSALQSMPFVEEAYPRTAVGYPDDMSFLQYTVECWVKPESTADATVIERTSFVDPSHCADERYVRRNFRLAIRDGRWHASFDANGTLDGSTVEVLGKTDAAANAWTYVAATYDANRLTLYVNGKADNYVMSSLKPEYGSSAVVVYPGDGTTMSTNGVMTGDIEASKGEPRTYWFDREYSLHAFLIGASFSDSTGDRYSLNVMNGRGWRGYHDFFTGCIDEVRVWDGAQPADVIESNFSSRKRYTREDAIANRNAFYDQWATGRVRYNKDGSGKDLDVIPELRFHWAFDSIPGAENAAAMAQAPHGFLNVLKPVWSAPEGYAIPWWSTVVAGYGSVYAGNLNWVPWIPNTVTHLPRFDGTTLDSAYWSEDYAGDAFGSYRFARTAEPVSKWTQMTRNATMKSTEFLSTSRRFWLSYNTGTNGTSMLSRLFEFTGRHLNQTGDDLLPLGGAFVKYVDEMWDDQGASTPWEQTGVDADNDGLPDWWQEYAEQNYRRDVPPGEDITWNTLIWYGVGGAQMRITAGEAYLRDLAKGAYVDANGEVQVGPTVFAQIADEDADGVPDWWADLYGIRGESGLADHDNDGLPNYVEYLLSEVFDFKIAFNPVVPDSVQKGVSDYFYKIGELYAGEIFTDHDLVDDLWEDIYPETFASRRVYDAFRDADSDGWSLRSECRYSKAVMPIVADQVSHYSTADGLTADYPIPTVELTLHYKGAKSDAVEKAPIVVQMTTEKKLESDFEAVFKVAGTASEAAEGQSASTGQSSKNSGTDATTAYTRSLGKWSNRHALGTLTPGYINQNSVKLQYCYDPTAEVYSWTVLTETYGYVKRGTRAEFDDDKRKYGDANIQLTSRDTDYRELVNVRLRTDEGSKTAFWENTSTGERFGTLDLVSGAFDIDFGAFKGQYVVNGTNAADFASLEDQTFRIAYSVNPSVGLPRKLYLGEATTGHVREGRNTIIAFADLDGNGAYTAGEPYGCVTDVNVSWRGTAASIDLSENSAVCPRMNIADGTSDREFTWGTESGYWTNHVVGVLNGGTKTRVRIVRSAYRGLAASKEYEVTALRDFDSTVPVSQLNRVVLDKYIDLSVNPLITEADFFAAGELDIDWSTLTSDISDNLMYRTSDGELIKFFYRIVLGEGAIDLSTLNNLHKIFFGRVFDTAYGRQQNPPVGIAPGPSAESILTESSPTFRWELPGMNSASTICSYPAFRIVVTEQANPGSVVFDSGIQRTPALKRENNKYVYEWKAPLFVGDRTLQNRVFENHRAYSWKVSMYNCKFKSDLFSAPGNFYVNVATNGYDRGNVDVDVRYFGPTNACLNKIVRVRAYTSPDFTGTPVAGASIDLGVAANRTSLTNCAVNCRIIGLPKGSYYLQAFIDSNANGVCDSWESMGYLCPRDGSTPDYLNPTAIAFDGRIGKGDTAVIYIEDADTDGDGLPDAWEYAQYGSLAAKGAEELSETAAGEFVINQGWAAAIKLQNGVKAPSAGLAGRIGSTLRNAGVLALSMGAPTAGYDSFSAAISGFVSPELVEDGVKITGLSMTDGTVSIKVEAETASAGAAWIEGRKTLEVMCQVKWKASLADSIWTNLGEPFLITVGAEAAEIDISGLVPAGDSGFYSVDVYKK